MQILTVILIIGILIFVHELGHFLAAKSLKIPVKVFSIGFPFGNFKPLISFKWGETDCQLNALPLGGFCAFMDDEKELEKNPDNPDFLNNRKVWERFIVISGGVVFNFIFAFIVAVVMFFSLGIPEGREYQDGVTIADVSSGSPADNAGIKALDTVIQVDDIPLNFEYDLNQVADNLIPSKSEQKEVDVSYLSNGIMNEGKLDFNKDGKRISTEEVRGIWITKILDGSIGSQAGFKENDIIVSINGKNFKGVRNPEGFMKGIFKENKGSAVKIDFIRDGKIQSFDVTPDSEGKIGVGIDFIKGLILKDKSLSIPENSIILEINKSPLYDTSSLMRQIIAKHKDGTPAKIIIKRKDEVLAPITVTPQESGIIGVQIQGAIKEVNRSPVSFIEPFTTSAKFITRTSVLLFDGLVKMVTGQLSSNEVGGPIMVVAKGAEIAKADYSKLFQFTILISLELVILNVIPLPAVDGGHLFLLIIEMIRGKRLKREFEEKIHYTGLLVLLGLGVFLIFKDVLTLSKIIK